MNRGINPVYLLTMSELSGVTLNLLKENVSPSDLLTRFQPCLLPISLEWVSYHSTIFLIFTKERGPVWCPPRRVPDHMLEDSRLIVKSALQLLWLLFWCLVPVLW